ncbi:hypothetical protein BVRB_022160 [Beta vulgaris subsp. vulgaris]|uniref:Uncharacterized protein n=1 Tax=Beta vulgaris subsp. vulgaris TaxID=3555 RepID=A0A0J8B3C7_BETVV|nr:hypothetical protein BVRB_022160 [Beta vulgaris subsp. vulgaris]
MWTCELGVSVGGPTTKVCSVEGIIRNPKYDLRREYRAHAFNPTCTIEIIVEGIERDSRKLKFVGVAALNVFTVRGAQAQPTQAQQQEFCLNSGNFQLPLYAELVRSKDVFLASSYSNLPRIPCATVLVRIVPAAKSKDLGEVLSTSTTPESAWVEKGLVSPAPSYNVG